MGFQLYSFLKGLGGSGSKGSWNEKHSEMAFTSRWSYYFKNCFSQISEEAAVTLGNLWEMFFFFFYLEEYCISCTH